MAERPRFVKDPNVEVLSTSEAKQGVGSPRYSGYNTPTAANKALKRLLFKVFLVPAILFTGLIAALLLIAVATTLG